MIDRGENVDTFVYLYPTHDWYSRFEEFGELKYVPDNKVWKVQLNSPAKKSTVKNDNVYVTDGSGVRLHTIDLSLSEDGKTITVKNNAPYVEGRKYKLHIEKRVQSTNGTKLHQEIIQQFIIKND